MTKRPLILDKDGMILAGNQRLKACKHLDWKEVPIEILTLEDLKTANKERKQLNIDNKNIDGWEILKPYTYKELCQEVTILDNVEYGQWDWVKLSSSKWKESKLKEWGIVSFDFKSAGVKKESAPPVDLPNDEPQGSEQNDNGLVSGKIKYTCPNCSHEFVINKSE